MGTPSPQTDSARGMMTLECTHLCLPNGPVSNRIMPELNASLGVVRGIIVDKQARMAYLSSAMSLLPLVRDVFDAMAQ